MDAPDRDGRRTTGERAARKRRNLLIVGAITLALVAFGGGYLLATGGGDPQVSASPTRARSPKPTAPPSASPSSSASSGPSSSPSNPPTAAPVLEDGRHFVFLKRASAQGDWTLTFDLAYFYADQDAIEECGPDVPNGYCIVNDNPRLRTLPVARTVGVRYIPLDACCALKPGSFSSLAAAVGSGPAGGYDPTAPYWITVRNGQIVRIEQQYLP